MDLWEKCVDFHGHHCGGLRIGYAAAEYAMKLLQMLGCSIGKGNLLFHMTGKQAFSFYHRPSGKSVRLVLKPKPLNMTPEESKGYYFDRTCEELFEVKPTRIPLPTPAKIFDSYYCGCCGEKTGANWIRIAGGKKLCLDCYESYDRFHV